PVSLTLLSVQLIGLNKCSKSVSILNKKSCFCYLVFLPKCAFGAFCFLPFLVLVDVIVVHGQTFDTGKA
uniref:Uncharacterized protein n=1 Tax=Aegilops tauschii subsp. strangulata TaxID=200361 RepID=A0A453BL28_AEGTS